MSREDETWRGMVIAAVICLSISLLVVGWRLIAKPAAAVWAPSVPAFSLERLRGGRVSLAELSGKVVVIDFWATWCPPCRAEMPWLVKLGTRFESQGVVFIAISEDDPPGQVPLVNEFAREVPGLERFAVLGDPEIESAYGVTSLPTLFVLNRQGQLVKQFVA